MAYNRGTEVELKATFKDAATDAVADPTDVVLEVLNPAGTLTSYQYSESEVTRASEGVFTKTQTLDASGSWYYRFSGTGSVIVAGWERIDVIDDPLS